MKTCPICETEKPPSAFYPDRRRENGLHTYCKDCCKVRAKTQYAKNPEASKAAHREWVKKNRHRIALHKAKAAYGLTEEQYLALAPICTICGATRDLVIDHSHQSGRVRGRLCSSCNKGLGFFKDNPTLVYRAADYLLGAATPAIFTATYEAVEEGGE